MNFNLGGKYRFHYNSLTKDLQVDENPHYIKDFFQISDKEPDNANIKLVSAIVGENGTGKTTFLDYIKENFIDGAGGFRSNAIVSFYDDSTEVVKVFISTSIKMSAESQKELKDKGISVELYGEKKVVSHSKKLNKLLDIRQSGEIQEAEEISYVYLSNIFDKRAEFEFSGLYNLSTNYLLQNDLKSKMENNFNTPFTSMVEEHRSSEIARELDFINEFNKGLRDYLNFQLPERLNVVLLKQEYQSRDQIFETEAYYFLKRLDDELNKCKEQLTNYQKFIYDLMLRATSNVLIEYYNYSSIHPINLKWLENHKFSFDSESYLRPIDKLLDYIIDNLQEFEFIQTKFKSVKNILHFLDSYVKKKDNAVSFEESVFQFHLDSVEDQNSFFEFYKHYKQSFNFASYLNFNWADLSTGQKALLNIYSRLFSISDVELERRASNLVLKKDVVLLIDEGELYLHPNWQREILFQLLKVIPIVFKRGLKEKDQPARNIQLILTSNSPLLITDIPASNIVFLKREGDSILIQDSLNDQKQTFAANINTLLSDSFFMENGLMGDFAFHRINEVITILQGSRKKIEDNKERIKRIILMIGEPVIREKLIQMMNERLSLDMIDLNERLTILETEVENLKKNK
jgi:predicted ATP-binding protein involved in virulence